MQKFITRFQKIAKLFEYVKHGFIILSNDYRLSLLVAIPRRVWKGR